MRSAAGGNLPQPAARSDRRKRRDRARKSSATSSNAFANLNNNGDDVDDIADAEDYRNAVRLDTLEGVVDVFDEQQQLEDDEEYDELEDYTADSGGGRKRRKAATKKKDVGTAIPKRFKPRSLASMLIEESSRVHHDGVLKKMLDAEARPPRRSQHGSSRISRHHHLKKRKFCPVTGLEGVYTDPKSGIPYANLKALEQIRERHPPWILQGSGGTASYFEAMKSLRNED